MNDNIQNTEPQGAIIPPWILLVVAAAGLLTGLGNFLATGGTLTTIGYAGLAIGVIAIVTLIVLAPQEVVNALTGRTLRFGGTSIVFTLVLFAVLIASYVLVKSQNWRTDFTESDQFTLTAQSEAFLADIAVDPSFPNVEVIGFFDSTQVTRQDNAELLLQQASDASAGKVTYQFINPDRNPAEAILYNVRPGDIIIRRAGDTEADNAIPLTGFTINQNEFINGILAVGVQGDFRAIFIDAEGALSLNTADGTGIQVLNDVLIQGYQWQVETAPISVLTALGGEITLNDPALDNEVLVFAGGLGQLSDDTVAALASYLENGGNLMIFGTPSLADETLSSSPALNAYLSEAFGISFGEGIVLDSEQAIQAIYIPVVNDFDPQQLITTTGVDQATAEVYMPFTTSITLAQTPPANVTIYNLASTSETSYIKMPEDFNANIAEKDDDDPVGPFSVMAAAENSETGARVFLVGSRDMAADQFAQLPNVVNVQMVLNAFVWTTRFDEFVNTIPEAVEFDQRPQDTPIFATDNQLNLISLISLFILPGIVVAAGLVVWSFRPR